MKIFLGLYTLFFIAGGIAAPVFAHFGNFEAAGALYAVFAKSCNQDALRSFWIMGYQMAICARCFGAYIGFLAVLISSYKFTKVHAVIFAIIGFGEKIAEFAGFAGNNYIRLISGCFLGAFLFIILLLGIRGIEKCIKKY